MIKFIKEIYFFHKTVVSVISISLGNGIRPMVRSLVFSSIPVILCYGFYIDVFHSSVNTSQFSFNYHNCGCF